MAGNQEAIDPEDLIAEVRELIGKHEPGVNGRVGFTHKPHTPAMLGDREVETVATSDVV